MKELLESECFIGNDWLHDYQTVSTLREGIFEVCTRCGDEKFWPHDTPSEVYLAFNVRRALQPNHPLFKREWQNFIGI